MNDTPTPAPVADAAPAPDAAPGPADGATSQAAPARKRSRGGRNRRKPQAAAPEQSAAASAASPQPSPARSRPGPQPPRSTPTLEQLATLYPRLFGAQFLPLKRGIYEDLQAAQPGVFEAQALKDALAQHTRSTRYLVEVAAGRPRHDLEGRVVEPMAPEHVHHALLEVFRRRARRPDAGDLRPQLRTRIVQAFEASGLAASAYDALVRSRDAEMNTLLDEALAEAGSRAARAEALLRAFEASGQSVEEFAGAYGMDVRETERLLQRARR